eukprot:TRINITY_DN43458_c0_g1_i1.p1 TRINITY_DN43458_c0_g1~~TRINITY_DN43458_c0_g1_i1.p1  ORF type:complete len:461 (-),score=93.54 TRINITY_DN43458_c0_g1_i1:114-1496(-)
MSAKNTSVGGSGGKKEIRFRTVFRNCILDCLRARGYKEADDDAWDFFWADVHWVRENLHTNVSASKRLDEHQRVNHFPNHYELTRKDMLTKNLKRAQKNLQREGQMAEAAQYDFLPKSFVLPGEYGPFLEEFKKGFGSYDYDSKSRIDNRELKCERKSSGIDNIWIMKPVGGRQGKGIFLFNKLCEISDWKKGVSWSSDDPQADTYLAQHYISNPYLVGGRKFDLRLYALVTSFSPLTLWMSRNGFARFSNSRFSMAKAEIKNALVHLTNVAIQSQDAAYDSEVGCKWGVQSLRKHIAFRHGEEATNRCFHEMQNVIIRSLLAVQKVIINDKNCFELYGYDLMIDSNLKPYLIEVNASPSISADTEDDYALKFGLLDDLMTIIDMEGNLTGQEEHIGGFDLVYQGSSVKQPPSYEVQSHIGCANDHGNSMRQLNRIYGAGKVGQSSGCKTPTWKRKKNTH